MNTEVIIAVDFHNHSEFSCDGQNSLNDFLNVSEIDVFAVTDHNNMDFHKKYSPGNSLYMLNNKWFIAGEEIMTSDAGEVIGLFLVEEIPAGMTFQETIRAIKEQGGIVYLPHPFDFYRKGRPNLQVVKKCIEQIDIVEVFNAKYLTPLEVKLSYSFAKKYSKTFAFGSDAHKPEDLARGYMVLKVPSKNLTKDLIIKTLTVRENIVDVVQKRKSFLKRLVRSLGR
uniref:PHP domain-containing protein n=1 Tax=Fervidobacterium pennivorans TaxID=93466 RepID=A0A7V4NF03_FERPE